MKDRGFEVGDNANVKMSPALSPISAASASSSPHTTPRRRKKLKDVLKSASGSPAKKSSPKIRPERYPAERSTWGYWQTLLFAAKVSNESLHWYARTQSGHS